jgi:hypothetical protein
VRSAATALNIVICLCQRCSRRKALSRVREYRRFESQTRVDAAYDEKIRRSRLRTLELTAASARELAVASANKVHASQFSPSPGGRRREPSDPTYFETLDQDMFSPTEVSVSVNVS